MYSRALGRLGFASKVGFKPSTTTGLPMLKSNFSPMSSSKLSKKSVASSESTSIPEPSLGIPVVVNACYVARAVEISRINTLYANLKIEPQSKSVTIHLNESLNKYVSIFNYGSVVFFNVPEEEHASHLLMIKTMAINPNSEVYAHTESYKLLIHENLEAPSVIHSAHLNIRSLDSSNLTIVGTVMAQTVAMDYFAFSVNKTIEAFAKMNKQIEDTGSFDNLDAKELHKMVAANNRVFTNVLAKVRSLFCEVVYLN